MSRKRRIPNAIPVVPTYPTYEKGEETASTKVSRYEALRKIAKGAWDVILPTFIPQLNGEQDDIGKDDLPNGKHSPFSEGLLRETLDLTPVQQLELCSDLVAGNINKNKFTTTAKAYRARNEASAWFQHQLGMMDEDFLNENQGYDTRRDRNHHHHQ